MPRSSHAWRTSARVLPRRTSSFAVHTLPCFTTHAKTPHSSQTLGDSVTVAPHTQRRRVPRTDEKVGDQSLEQYFVISLSIVSTQDRFVDRTMARCDPSRMLFQWNSICNPLCVLADRVLTTIAMNQNRGKQVLRLQLVTAEANERRQE